MLSGIHLSLKFGWKHVARIASLISGDSSKNKLNRFVRELIKGVIKKEQYFKFFSFKFSNRDFKENNVGIKIP